MRRVEYLRLGIPALLKETEKSPVTLTFRGVNDKNEKLYEARTRSGEIIAAQATEKELLESIIERQAVLKCEEK